MSASYPSPHPAPESPLSPSQKLALHLNGHAQSMDGRQNDYSQPGLNSPYPFSTSEPQSEGSSADQASAAQYPAASDPRSANFSSSATPTSEYGINPSSARSGSFPDYVQRGHYPPAGQPPQAGNMAQATSPSMPLPDGNANNNAQSNKSDPEVPIDPSIAAAASPTYPPHGQYSPYPPQHEMSHYGAHPAPVYGRPDQWGSHYPGMYGHAPVTTGPPAPSMVSPVQRPPTVSRARPTSRTAPLVLTRQCCRAATPSLPFTLSCRFRARSNISVRVGVTKKSSACINVVGMGVKRHMERLTTLTRTSRCNRTVKSARQKVRGAGPPPLAAMACVARDRPQVYFRRAFGVANYFGGSRSVGDPRLGGRKLVQDYPCPV